MTERTPFILPPIAQSQPASNSLVVNHLESVPVAADSSAEEPYTIKCICEYDHADTNTICCDKCETWQHYECYYDGDFAKASSDDFAHQCVDCQPRHVDRRKAHEQQRLREEQRRFAREGEIKKTKRPSSKTHKKKQSEAVNGLHDATSHRGSKSGLGADIPQAKRAKTQHRTQNSISSQGVKRSPALHSRHNSHAHPLSPATTPPELPDDFVVHGYSDQFVSCWHNDPGAQELPANLLTSLNVTSTMSSWLHSDDTLLQDTKHTSAEVFKKIKPDTNFALSKFPKLQLVQRSINARGTEVQIKALAVAEPVREGRLLGELKGAVGFQKDYSQESPDQYSKLCHPAPFVFFHPKLPIYIDTRKEGSQCRYVRRSCRPNTTLETLIANEQEYHFCFVADASLATNTQITMPWEFVFPEKESERFKRILCLSDEGTEDMEITQEVYDQLSEMVDSLLSEYGGCACDLGHDCAFVRFHRNYQARHQIQMQPKKQKRSRKTKQQHVSPTSTGYATNSRDPSEGHRGGSDAEESVSSKRHDRGLNGSAAHSEVLPGGIVSDRDKRKLADIEKSFEQMDKLPPKKKKKSLDSNHQSSVPAPASSSHRSKGKGPSRNGSGLGLSTGNRGRKSVSRQQSESPATGISPKTLPISIPRCHQQKSKRRQVQYVESGMQTEDDLDAWYKTPQEPPRNTYRKFAVASFIKDIHRNRLENFTPARSLPPLEPEDAVKTAIENGWVTLDAKPVKLFKLEVKKESSPSVSLPHNNIQQTATVEPCAPQSSDTIMTDAPPIGSVTVERPPPPLWPGISKSVDVAIPATQPILPQDSKIALSSPPQLPPKQASAPILPAMVGNSQSPPLTESPLEIGQPVPSPAPVPAIVPAPVKKKLSLKDYMRKNAAAHPAKAKLADSKPSSGLTPAALPVVPESKPNGISNPTATEVSLVNGDTDTVMGGVTDDTPSKAAEVTVNGDVPHV